MKPPFFKSALWHILIGEICAVLLMALLALFLPLSKWEFAGLIGVAVLVFSAHGHWAAGWLSERHGGTKMRYLWWSR